MPSKYANKHKPPPRIEKQDAALPYKAHWRSPPPTEVCSNCGRTRPVPEGIKGWGKCWCGGTYQRFGAGAE